MEITRRYISCSVLIFVFLVLFIACSGTKKAKTPPTVTEIRSSRRPRGRIRAGEEVYLDVDIDNPGSIPLKLEWGVISGGGFVDPSSGSTKVAYQAPDSEGKAIVRLQVRYSDKVIEKTLPLQILPESPPVDVIANCVFAGWMGDGETHGEEAITLDDVWSEGAHSPPACVRITYTPMTRRWAGIYAQFNVGMVGENWGERPGRDLTGYTKLVWYAKGETGNEMVEFKTGGIDAPGMQYKDSFEITLGTIKLETEWTRYELDLTDYDLSSVIGGFCWVATERANPNGLTFYVDSITYE